MLRIAQDPYLDDLDLDFNVLTFLSFRDLSIGIAVSKAWQKMIASVYLEMQITPARQTDFTELLIKLIHVRNYNLIQRHIEYGIQHGLQLNQIYQNTVKVSSSIIFGNPTPLLLSAYMLDGQAGAQIFQSLMYKPVFDFFLYYTRDNKEIMLSDDNQSLVITNEDGHPLIIADFNQLKKARESYTPILIRSNDDFLVYRARPDEKQTWELIPLIREIEDESEELRELYSFPFVENQLVHIQKRELSHIAFNLIYDFEYIGPEHRKLSTFIRDELFTFGHGMISPGQCSLYSPLLLCISKLAACEATLMSIQASGHHQIRADLLTDDVVASLLEIKAYNKPLVHGYLNRLLSINNALPSLPGISRRLNEEDVAILRANGKFNLLIQDNPAPSFYEPYAGAACAILTNSFMVIVSFALGYFCYLQFLFSISLLFAPLILLSACLSLLCVLLTSISLSALYLTITNIHDYFPSDVVCRNETEIKEQPSPKPFISNIGLFFKPLQNSKPQEVKIEVISDSKVSASASSASQALCYNK